MNLQVLSTCHHLEIPEVIIERVQVFVMDEPPSWDLTVRLLPDDASAIAPLAVFAFDLDVAVADTG
jgi:hypothetical protein